jgi:hypothetical protein
MFVPHRKHASTACYGDGFTSLYLDDVLTSQETCLHGLLGNRFTFLYVDDVRTSEETHGSTACYMDMLYTEMALLLYM